MRRDGVVVVAVKRDLSAGELFRAFMRSVDPWDEVSSRNGKNIAAWGNCDSDSVSFPSQRTQEVLDQVRNYITR